MALGASATSALRYDANADEAAKLETVDHLEAAVAARPSVAQLATILEALGQALEDSSAAVLKRAIPAAHVAFRPGHAAALALGRGPQVPEDVGAAWQACLAAKQRVSQLVSQPGLGSDGVRMLGAKFLDNTLLLMSAEAAANPKAPRAQHALLSAALVAKEADGTIQQLVGLIKPPGLTALPGPVVIVVLKGLGSIAAQRPQYLGRILPTLLSLASTLKQPQEEGKPRSSASVVRALKDALLCVLRCRAPQALTWHRKIVASLQSLGAGEAAEAEVRRAERQAKRERGRDPGSDVGAKKPRLEEPKEETPAPAALTQAAMPEEAQVQEAAQPAQLPAAQQPAPERTLLERLLHECSEVTGVNELFQVIAVMSVLATEKDLLTLQGFSSGLSPSVLADVVIANLDHMPRREDVAGAQNASSGTSALASLMQGLSDNQAAGRQAQQQQAPAQQSIAASASVPSVQPGQNISTSQPQAAPQHSKPAAPQAKEPLPRKPAKPAPKPIMKRQAAPALKRKVLAPDQEAALRLGAVQRILASEAVPAQHLRSSVLAALASRQFYSFTLAPIGDAAADMVLQHILANFRQPGSYSLALQWLYSLFVAYSQADVSTQHEAAASAHVNAPQLRAKLVSALDDDGDMAASSAGNSNQQLAASGSQAEVSAHGLSLLPASDAASSRADAPSARQQPDQAAVDHEGGSVAAALQIKAQQQDGLVGGPLAIRDSSAPMEISQSADGGSLAVQRDTRDAGMRGRDHAADLAGTLYETVLLAILKGLREQISPDEKLISRLLIDSPALPAGGVMAFLRDVCSSGGDWSTLALSSAYDIIMKRPPARLPALQVVLDAATGADADIRNKAVRLVANRLFSERSLQEAITGFATAKVKELLPAPKPALPAIAAAPAETLLAHPSSASAAAASDGKRLPSAELTANAKDTAMSAQPHQVAENTAPSSSSSNGHREPEQPDLQQPKVKREPLADELAAGQPHQTTNGLPSKAAPKTEHQQQSAAASSKVGAPAAVKQEEAAQATEPMQIDIPAQRVSDNTGLAVEAAPSGLAASGGKTASAQPDEKRAKHEQMGSAAGGCVVAVPEQAIQVAPALGQAIQLSAEEAAERCELLCALCTKAPDLLRLLLEVFGKAGVNGRKAISKNARLLARAVGPQAPIWVDLLARIPPKSEPLLLNMLLTLTGDAVPPKALADACMAAHVRLRQARFVVPALAALERPRALSLLPKLAPLDAVMFKAAMHRLMLTQPGTAEALLAPQEILIALLTLNLQAEGLTLKSIMAAVTHCFAMRDIGQGLVFPSEALASTMQQLVVRQATPDPCWLALTPWSPLPALFMRFVIQSVTNAPQLRAFVCGILAELVNKAVWSTKQQWTGWVKCVQDLVPDSLPVLLQLPVGNLETALRELAPAVTLKAEAFLDGPKTGPLPKQTRAAVKRRADELRQQAAAKKQAASAAKAEAAAKSDAAGKPAASAAVESAAPAATSDAAARPAAAPAMASAASLVKIEAPVKPDAAATEPAAAAKNQAASAAKPDAAAPTLEKDAGKASTGRTMSTAND